MSAPKIPLSLFSIPFGLAGLAGTWTVSAGHHHSPEVVNEIIWATSAATWVVVLGAYLRHLVGDRTAVVKDLLDPGGAPFAALSVITPMLLASQGLHPHAATAGRVLTDVFVVLTVLLGGWFTGQWIYGAVELDTLHPGYFLPTAAGGLIAAAAAAAVGQHRLAEIMFGLGVVCWIMLGSIILARLMFRPTLPPPLLPTLAIEIAPPAVASLAWFQIHGAQVDVVTAVLAGYGLIMVLAQLRLLPTYLRLPFMLSTWAFTFSWAAVATVTLIWLENGHVAGYRVWQYLVLAAITLFVAAIGARTLLALSRRELLPASRVPSA